MSVTALVNGEPASSVDVSDRGFQYGDGVFTTLLIRRGTPLFLTLHLERLEHDCRRLSIPFPGHDALTREAQLLCRDLSEGVLKIQITRGRGGRGYRPPEPAAFTRVLSLHPPPAYPSELRDQGVQVRICSARLGVNPGLAGIKHTNRLEQILARLEWSQTEIHEGLMLDAEGHVTEGTMTNLFLVQRGILLTPRLDLCGVAGVMRALMGEAARTLGLECREKRILPDELYAADEIFLTNSVIGLWPVRRLEGRTFAVGPVTRELSEWLAIRIREESASADMG